MTHLLRIVLCLAAALLMIPLDEECSEIMEFQSETEVAVECVRASEAGELPQETVVSIINAPAMARPSSVFAAESPAVEAAADLRLRHCVFRE